MEAVTGPLPRLKMDGIDNTDQIITAIGEFKKTHAPEEVEHAVHDWYEAYDGQLAASIQDNLNRQILMQENQANGYDLCRQGGDYEKCAKRQTSEAVGARNDQATMARNNALIPPTAECIYEDTERSWPVRASLHLVQGSHHQQYRQPVEWSSFSKYITTR